MWGADVEGLLGQPWLARLTALELPQSSIGDEGAATLAASSHLRGLSSLGLEGNRIGAKGVAALTASLHLAGLSKLDLGSNGIGAAVADESLQAICYGYKQLFAADGLHSRIRPRLFGPAVPRFSGTIHSDGFFE